MQRIRVWAFTIALIAVALLCSSTPSIFAQSLTTGDIVGTVTDPTGAVVPAANVALKSIETGKSQATTTNESGEYRFRLLTPGRYSVTVAQTGFTTITRPVSVNVGQIVTANLTLAV